jgi:two-component system LytT family response regulator
MKVAIVDDEPLARLGIRQLLAKHTDVEVAGEARDGREAAALLARERVDVVFLDVQLPEADGFEVLRALPASAPPYVIFVTAFDTFAVKAFDAHALDYLVKPVQATRFDEAVARARIRLSLDAARSRSEALARRLAEREARPSRLAFHTGSAELIAAPDDVTWIEADDYYAAVHVHGRRHLVRESLAALEARLDPQRFVRVHRSAIVNLAHVVEVRGGAHGEAAAVLRDGRTILVSRRRRDAVIAAVSRFVRTRD